MDRARRPTLGFFSQNLHATHTNLAKSSGGPYVAAELRGDGPAVEHLATGTEAVNRRIARRLVDDYCSSVTQELFHAIYLSLWKVE